MNLYNIIEAGGLKVGDKVYNVRDPNDIFTVSKITKNPDESITIGTGTFEGFTINDEDTTWKKIKLGGKK